MAGLFEAEAKEGYMRLKNEEKKIVSQMDEIVYDFLGYSVVELS
jgi:hypothetical protein